MIKSVLAAGILAGSMSTAIAGATTTPSTTVVTAGDIACLPSARVTATTCQQVATEKLAASLSPTAVFPLGDLVYPSGTYSNLVKGYTPTWGKLRSISHPVSGNHEGGPTAGYYQYWAGKANPRAPHCLQNCMGYYSLNVGNWHVMVLNSSSCSELGVCAKFTNQVTWIKKDLAANPSLCTLAFIHNPLWSYGISATLAVKPLFQALYNGGVDLVVSGHDHNYQRFASQNISGQVIPNGLTEIIAGTGGDSQMPVGKAPNQVAAFDDFGVLDLGLNLAGWTSSFHSISGTVKDSATGACH